ncbi:DUF397 domain-containing protein [Glycomyces paridis]|uniref:DUF397 domain-containing protein n=1 Tax=Glycomyces paridis TaxID=2126555 RepID=A0A4S8PVR0_9ACTN|nr:DUF397 domain-containing protein [Glycomyces paridis]
MRSAEFGLSAVGVEEVFEGEDAAVGRVELDRAPDRVDAVRHSHHPEGSMIIYTCAEWAAFLGGAKDGEYDFGR